MTSFVRALALVFVAVAGAACTSPLASGPEHAYNVEEQYPIVVEPQVATLVVQVDEGLQSLGRGEHERVRAFVERWKTRGQGMLNAAVPTGSKNQAAAAEAVNEIKDVLFASGVEKPSVQFTTYRAAEGDERAPITLTFVTYAAMASECGSNWTRNLAWNPRNTPWPEFGCSSQHNFAASVSDPRDLIEPRTMDPIDANRRSTVLEKYRAGEPTRTFDKSKTDSGEVSNVQPK